MHYMAITCNFHNCKHSCFLLAYQHVKTPPRSVVLVGHSMGGVVARALFTLPRFNSNLVSLIITQASPHLAPVLALDPYLPGKENSHAGLEWYIDTLCSEMCLQVFMSS